MAKPRKDLFKRIEEEFGAYNIGPTFRRTINRHIENAFKEQGKIKWEQLTEQEKDMFLYVFEKDKLFEMARTSNAKKEKINEKIKDSWLLESNDIKLHNKKESDYDKQFYDEKQTEEQKKTAYKGLVKAFGKYDIRDVSIPTYDEWVKEHHTIREYCKYYEEMLIAEDVYDAKQVEESRVDHVLFRTLMKYINEDLFGEVEIDTDMIRRALTFIDGFPVEDVGKLEYQLKSADELERTQLEDECKSDCIDEIKNKYHEKLVEIAERKETDGTSEQIRIKSGEQLDLEEKTGNPAAICQDNELFNKYRKLEEEILYKKLRELCHDELAELERKQKEEIHQNRLKKIYTEKMDAECLNELLKSIPKEELEEIYMQNKKKKIQDNRLYQLYKRKLENFDFYRVTDEKNSD